MTARGASASEQIARSRRAWAIRGDESLFLVGLDKGPSCRVLATRSSSTISIGPAYHRPVSSLGAMFPSA